MTLIHRTATIILASSALVAAMNLATRETARAQSGSTPAAAPSPSAKSGAKSGAKSEAKSEAKSQNPTSATGAKTSAKAGKKSDTKSDAKSSAKSSARSPTGGATLLGSFAGWGAYTASSSGRKICFALAKPSSSTSKPAGRPRDPAYMFVTTRPNEKVKEEVSINAGYPFKPRSEASLEAGGGRFALYTQGDGAWIKNAAEEGRMVDALRKSAQAVVVGTSSKGTELTDTFALKGLAQALDRIAQECP